MRLSRLLVLAAPPIAAAAAAAGCATGGGGFGGGGFGGATTTTTTTSLGGFGGATTTTSVGGSGGDTTSSSSSTSSTSASSSTSSTSASSSSSSSSASSSSSSSASSASSASSSGGGSCPIGHLLISEIRSRGAAGAGDELVELWNPTNAPVVLDSTWKLEARSHTAGSYGARWTGGGKTIPAHGHFLLAFTGYTQQPAADEALTTGITDATALRLVQSGNTVDAVCYAYDATTQTPFLTDTGYTCEGAPADNLPHNNNSNATTNVDVSIERKPGGALGHCTDTGDNAADFATKMPATPMSSTSPPAP